MPGWGPSLLSLNELPFSWAITANFPRRGTSELEWEAEWGEEDVPGLGTTWAKVQRWDLSACLGSWETGRPTDLGLHDPPLPVATTVELSIGSIHGSRGLTCWRLQPVLPSLGLGSEWKWCGGKPVPASSFRLPDQLAGPAATSGPTLPNVLGGDPFPKSFLSLGLGTQKALKWSSARRGPGPRGLLVLAPGGC